MQKYSVLIAFEQYAAGDIILLNPRQAKYLLLSGHIKLKPADKVKADK